MRIEQIKAALARGVELEPAGRIFVSTSRAGRDVNGNRIAHFSARIYPKDAGFVEVCASGKRRPQVGFSGNGRHEGAEVALEKLGYKLTFKMTNVLGEAVYSIDNLGV